MPTGKVAAEFFERLAKLEERVKHLMSYQKWQTGLLTAIFLMAVKAWVSK